MENLLKITPLGGLGQIGSNATLFQFGRTNVLVDAGILFPNDDFFDINYLIPDFSKIPIPEHLIITHAHEDHIGAIGHVLKRFPEIKIHASPLAKELILHKIRRDFPINEITPNTVFSFGEFTFHPISVTHSIPETYALLLKDNRDKLAVLYLSDFKLPIDFKKMTNLCQKTKMRILMADSTNILEKSASLIQETDLIHDLEKIFEEASGRIFVTLFASNLERLKNLIYLGKKYNRKIVPYGRSINNYLEIAQRLDLLEKKITLSSYNNINPNSDRLLVLISGCQGDFRSSLRRVALGEDSTFTPRPSDSFVFSSRAIPGNEKSIIQVINQLAKYNVKIITPRDGRIHATGHATPKELQKVCDKFSPTDLIPIHGDTFFLKKHAAFIKSIYPKINTHALENFHSLIVKDNLSTEHLSTDAPEPLIIHGNGIPIEREAIRQRRKLACNGVIFLSVDPINLKYQLSFMGLPQEILELNLPQFENFLTSFLKTINLKNEVAELQNSIRRYWDHLLGYRPVVVVHCT